MRGKKLCAVGMDCNASAGRDPKRQRRSEFLVLGTKPGALAPSIAIIFAGKELKAVALSAALRLKAEGCNT